MLMLHVARGYSLRETVVRAKLANWTDISDVALLNVREAPRGDGLSFRDGVEPANRGDLSDADTQAAVLRNVSPVSSWRERR